MDTQCISCQYQKGMFVYNHQIISNFARDKRRCLNRMFIMVPMCLPDNDQDTSGNHDGSGVSVQPPQRDCTRENEQFYDVWQYYLK